MPWKVSDVLDERTRFVLDYERGFHTMAELCRQYGIARKTGYIWVQRYTEQGLEGLQDRPRAPGWHPNQTPEEIEQRLLSLRGQHPRWGPKKLRGYLEQRQPELPWPALSTIGELLKREGLTIPQRRRRHAPPYTQPVLEAIQPNRVWCADFKGWFRTRDGDRIDPLTLTDACSRYLLRCQTVERTNTEQVRAILEAAFREYGLPWALHTDNGAPFGSCGLAGLTHLSVYLIRLGIVPERSRPGHPQDNGRHERMHRTLKAETARPPAANRRAQQRAFDGFRREYNEERPHEALGQKTPSSCYLVSEREYPRRLPEPEYDSSWQVRRVKGKGDFSWKHQPVYLTKALAGQDVGLEPMDDRYWLVHFGSLPIGRFDSLDLRVLALPRLRHRLANN
jgi:putative transposase